MQRRHGRRSARVEHEYRWAHLAKHGFGEHWIGGVAGNDRDTESSLELGEARGIARDYGDVGMMRDERFNYAETEPTATTGDDNALLFECLHDCSVLLLLHPAELILIRALR